MPAAGGRRRLHVLVVEDSPSIAHIARFWLHVLHEHTVTLWQSDFAALLTSGPWAGVDVALVDLMLPGGVDGLDILRYLRDRHPAVRRVVWSAKADIEPNIPALADAALTKPAREAEILAAIEGGP